MARKEYIDVRKTGRRALERNERRENTARGKD